MSLSFTDSKSDVSMTFEEFVEVNILASLLLKFVNLYKCILLP